MSALCLYCALFVNLRDLQNVLRNLEMALAQLANSCPKSDPNRNRNLAKSRSKNCADSQTACFMLSGHESCGD